MALMPSLPDFIFVEKLGKGSFATVYKAYRKGSQREVVAIKCVLKSTLTKSAVDNLITEISILKKIKFEHIVELKDFVWDDTYIFLIMEFCGGGDLSMFIKSKRRLSEVVAQKFLQQLAAGLQVLRQNNISHMDLKPQNIFLSSRSNPVLKIGDLGLAQHLGVDDAASSLRGSPLYMAPEILLHHHYDARVDLWSVGIIFYECLFGKPPFHSQTFTELAEKIKQEAEIELPVGIRVSDACRDLILNLLRRDPQKRISFEEFFNHSFVDLEHRPTQKSFLTGSELAKDAVLADSEGQRETAVHLYGTALGYLIPHLHNEKDPIRKSELRKKLMEYMNRAEDLRKAKPEKKTPPCDLKEILSSQPNLDKAFFIAHQADLMGKDGFPGEACNLLQSALEIMVPAVSNAEPGPQKDTLYAEVERWMQKAEDLKSFQKVLRPERATEDSNCNVQ